MFGLVAQFLFSFEGKVRVGSFMMTKSVTLIDESVEALTSVFGHFESRNLNVVKVQLPLALLKRNIL